jgi:endonuclease/exonuclease/phosphatase (EEP) superfamily protein YafD
MFAVPVLVIGVFKIFDHWNLLAEQSPLYGLDFLPAIWLVLCAAPGSLFLLAGGMRRAAASCALLAMTVYFVGGDYSFASVLRTKADEPKSVIGPPVTVVALNVEYFAEGERKVLGTLAQMDADIYLLSEVAFDDSGSTLLRSLMPGFQVFAGHRNSTAILTRLPLLSAQEVGLPSHEASLSAGNDVASMQSHPHRTFIDAVVDIAGQPVHAISVRFIAGRPKDRSLTENLRWGHYLLQEQKKEVEFFIAYLRGIPGPVVFGGDLNAPPKSKTMRPIEESASDAYLADHVWGAPTFRTMRPTMRLDYLFSTHGIAAVSSERGNEVVSDHFPVVARMVLVGPVPLVSGTPLKIMHR